MNTTTNQKRYKRSRQREHILAKLRSTKTHPTAAWIYDELKPEFPELSLGTVYRNLNILRDQGLLQVLSSGSTFDRFDANTAPHYHFVCTACGKVEDVDVQVREDIDERIGARIGRRIVGHRLDFFGLCPDCSN